MRHPRFGALRAHQAAVLKIVQDIINKMHGDTTFADITPGGGKTLLAAIFANLLIEAGLVDAVVAMVPSVALLNQLRDGFFVPDRGLTRRLAVWGQKGQRVGQRSTGGHDCVGWLLSYSTPPSTIRKVLESLKGKRILFIPDEFHHIGAKREGDSADDTDETGRVAESVRKTWKAAADLLRFGFDKKRKDGTVKEHVSGAVFSLLMSGTTWRHDGLDLPYLENHRGFDGLPQADIHYSRRNALEEHAVLPMIFVLRDGEVRFSLRGVEYTQTLSSADGKLRAPALRAFLEGDATSRSVLDECVEHWRDYRTNRYRSRMLVLCRTRADARRWADYLRDVLKVGEVALAIGNEPDAAKTIQRFRNGSHGDVLVTVRMAYEGFDVPNITHVACLTNVRSTQFLDQCFNRATRVNHTCGLSWEQQSAYIFAPCDIATQRYANTIHADQRHLVEGSGHTEARQATESTVRRIRTDFSVIEALPGGVREGDEEGLLTAEDSARVQRIKKAIGGMFDWSPRAVLAAAAKLREEAP